MKYKINVLLAVFGLLVSTGCIGPYYGKQSQYDKGDWIGLTGNQGVNQRQQQMLAIEKLRVQPVMTGTMTATGVVANVTPASAIGKTTPAGYKGVVVNNSSSRSYSFSIRGGAEDKDYFLAPGQRALDEECYLLPGRYTVTIHDGGDQIGKPQIIDVGPRVKLFQNEKCHWYAVAKW